MSQFSKLVRLCRAFRGTKVFSVKMNKKHGQYQIQGKTKKRCKNAEKPGAESSTKSETQVESSTRNETQVNSVEICSQNEPLPEIFILNADCFGEVFEYLTLHDLHSFGQSCKAMQQIAGEYFQRNYKSAEKFTANDGIYTVSHDTKTVINERIQTSSFNRFTNYFSHYYEEPEPLRNIELHSDEFTSVNHIYLVCLELNENKVEYLRKILPKLEVVQLRQCTMTDDFYRAFLKHCGNLKRIYIQDDLGDILDEDGSPWLLRTYPSLEHLQLTPRYSFQIAELSEFFERNPSVRSFSTNLRCFWENRSELTRSNAQLDTLEILILDKFHRHLINMQSVFNLLNQLHSRGFYKKLHLHVKRIDQKFSEELIALNGLEKLSIVQFTECYNLSRLIDLKKLNVDGSVKACDIEILAKNLVNLECISIGNANCNDILPFIRHTVKLRKIRTDCHESGLLNLTVLNEERRKLFGARKVTIYVPGHIFLATKWAVVNGDTNLSLVEIKRSSSQC